MAVQPPSGPLQPTDGSNIFRRGKPVFPRKPVPPPNDELSGIDNEDVFGIDEIDYAPETPVPPKRAGRPGETMGELDLGAIADPADLDPEAIFGSAPPVSSGTESSIFYSGSPSPTAPGSGWMDSGVGKGSPGSTARIDAENLFADLRGDAPDSGANWVEESATGRVSESELNRSLIRGESELADDIDLESGPFPNATGIPSSIFEGAGAGGSTESVDINDLPMIDGEDADLFSSETTMGGGGSSIFDRALVRDLEQKLRDESDAKNRVGFEATANADDAASQASGRIEWAEPELDEHGSQELPGPELRGEGDLDLSSPELDIGELSEGDLLFDDASNTQGETRSVRPALGETDDRTPAIAAALAAGALAPKAKPKAEPPSKKSAPKPPTTPKTPRKRDESGSARGGVGKLVLGGLAGALVASAGFAGLYFGGFLTNEKQSAQPLALAGPDLSGTVKKLEADLQDAAAKAKSLETRFNDAEDRLKVAEINGTRDINAVKVERDNALTKATATTKDLAKATQESTSAKLDAQIAKTKLSKVETDLESVKTESETSKKLASDAVAAMELAKRDAATASAKLKEAESGLKAVLTELKTAKLIDEKADATALPAAIRTLTATATSADAKKAAEALIAVQKELDASKLAVKQADDARIAALKTSEDSKKEIGELKAGLDGKVKDAVEFALKDSKAKLAQIEVARKTELQAAKANAEKAELRRLEDIKSMEARIAQLETEFARKLADARTGGTVALTTAEADGIEKGKKRFAEGIAAYDAGQFSNAAPLFALATQADAGDARYWYFLGLCQYQTGNIAGATASFKKGGELEARSKPLAKIVEASLERVPFGVRKMLNEYRP